MALLAAPAPQEHALLPSSPSESSDDGGTAFLPAAPAVGFGNEIGRDFFANRKEQGV